MSGASQRVADSTVADFELPALSVETERALRESILSHGVLVPIVLSAGPACAGMIADGRARAAICLEHGLEAPSESRRFGDDAEFRLYRLVTNLERRQLTVPQRIRWGLRLEPLYREQATKRKAQAANGKQGEKALPVALPEEKGETRELVARAVGLKPSTYGRGARVFKEGSERLVADLDAERLSVNAAYRRLNHEQRRTTRERLARQLAEHPLPFPTQRHTVLAIDPPWHYDDLPYPTMTLEQIAALPIPDLLDDNGIVWLWTTNTYLPDAHRIATIDWRLTYRSMLTWAKDRPGTGAWLRGQSEHALLLSRGSPLWIPNNATTLLTAKVREHSRKPEEFYELVERTCPGSKLDLFARQHRPGWNHWGAETNHFPG
jgi:N6-adenosine-specific RNA methylase IME4/ParB-like chromosome segregation protein Spo0J